MVMVNFQTNTSIYGMTCMIDGNFGNVSAGVLFSKVAYSTKRVVTMTPVYPWHDSIHKRTPISRLHFERKMNSMKLRVRLSLK